MNAKKEHKPVDRRKFIQNGMRLTLEPLWLG